MPEIAIPEIKNSAEIILTYAGLSAEDIAKIKNKIDAFSSLSDQMATDDKTRVLRKELNAMFFEIYKAVFFRTLDGERIPAEVLMFLYFGYIDEKLAGEENAKILYKSAVTMGFDERAKVFPFYQWARLIYMGKKDPSVNEFSLDYVATLRQMKREKSITDAEEQELLRDGKKRVIFEIDNMFKSVDKVMSQRVVSFIPFFSKQYLTKPLDKIILGFDTVHMTMNLVRAVDFSAFYRQTLYTNPEIGIDKYFMDVEVLPDVILLPCIGGRAQMWQEITGAKRNTPGRFILPIMQEEELTKLMVRLFAEFRWELCKRIQGARWNDLTERSLTSDYVDYIDTYRKNRDLSQEVRERIKSQMQKCRNSYKEMFIMDYTQFVQFESTGSIRLNKVVRNILFKYCPFSKMIREGAIATNPQYSQLLEMYYNNNKHNKHLLDVLMGRITKAGHQIPPELKDLMMYYNK